MLLSHRGKQILLWRCLRYHRSLLPSEAQQLAESLSHLGSVVELLFNSLFRIPNSTLVRESPNSCLFAILSICPLSPCWANGCLIPLLAEVRALAFGITRQSEGTRIRQGSKAHVGKVHPLLKTDPSTRPQTERNDGKCKQSIQQLHFVFY